MIINKTNPDWMAAGRMSNDYTNWIQLNFKRWVFKLFRVTYMFTSFTINYVFGHTQHDQRKIAQRGAVPWTKEL